MEEIILGYTLAKPVMTLDECTAYAAMAQAVNHHNATCTDTRWMIEDGESCYTVAAVPPPTDEELAAQEKAHREAQQRKEALDKLPETLEALKNENEMLKQCLLEMSETVYA